MDRKKGHHKLVPGDCRPEPIFFVNSVSQLLSGMLYTTVGFHKSLRGPSVWSKTTLIKGHVGGAGACPPTCKMGTFFHIPLALTMPINNNFQLNGASG